MRTRSQSQAFAKDLSPDQLEAYNQRFAEQVERLGLWFSCRDCVHLDTDTMACSHEYPNEHLKAAAEERRALNPDGNLVFCKYFEMP